MRCDPADTPQQCTASSSHPGRPAGTGEQEQGTGIPARRKSPSLPGPDRGNTAKASRVLHSLHLLSYSCISKSNYIYKITAFFFFLCISPKLLSCVLFLPHILNVLWQQEEPQLV